MEARRQLLPEHIGGDLRLISRDRQQVDHTRPRAEGARPRSVSGGSRPAHQSALGAQLSPGIERLAHRAAPMGEGHERRRHALVSLKRIRRPSHEGAHAAREAKLETARQRAPLHLALSHRPVPPAPSGAAITTARHELSPCLSLESVSVSNAPPALPRCAVAPTERHLHVCSALRALALRIRTAAVRLSAAVRVLSLSILIALLSPHRFQCASAELARTTFLQ
eukprot:scaffold14068_cov119-Isochrysis_galbana.AAC.15